MKEMGQDSETWDKILPTGEVILMRGDKILEHGTRFCKIGGDLNGMGLLI